MRKKLFLGIIVIYLICSSKSAVLECKWDPYMTICTPYNITPVTQPNEVITINGQPSNYVNFNTNILWLYKQIINYIPTGLFTLFPNMSVLDFDNSKVTMLTTDSIPNCGILNQFGMRGGTFTNIPAGVLQSCKSLTSLLISYTSVTTVDVDAFRGLTNLTLLLLTMNQISCIEPGLFQHTPLLESIVLQNNLITSIDANLFSSLYYLSTLYLSQNLITIIPKMNLTGQNGSLSVDFSSNPVYAVTPDFCSILSTRSEDTIHFKINNFQCMISPFTIVVTASSCQNDVAQLQNCIANWTSTMNTPAPCGQQTFLAPITVAPTTIAPTTVPPTTVPPTTAVVTTPSPIPGSCPSDKVCRYFLDQYNRYTCILDGVDSVLTSISGNHLITFADSNVRRVIFTNSFLSRIPPILFQKFTSLEYLTVSNCSMSAINTNTFTACGSLKYFDASSNFITTVDGASFKNCAALEVIDLTGNSFDMISGQLFVNNPTLKAVYINRPPAMVLV